MEVYAYGKYLKNGYTDASNHDTVTENPTGGYLSTWTGEKFYNVSSYGSNYTVKTDDAGYPYVGCDTVADYTSIYNSSNEGFSINGIKGWLYSEQWKTANCLSPNTVTIKCKLRFNKSLMDSIDDGEYYFLKFNSNLYGLYLNKIDTEWYFNNSVKIPSGMFNDYVNTTITLFFGSNNYNTSRAYNLRTLIEIDDIALYTFATSDNINVYNILTAYSTDAFYITDIELYTYFHDSLNRNETIIKARPETVYPTGKVKLKLSNYGDPSVLRYYSLSEPVERLKQSETDNDSVSYVLNLIKETSNLKEKIIQDIDAYDKFPKRYLTVLADTSNEEIYNISDSSILELPEAPNILYKYTDNKIYAVMLSDEETEKYIRIKNYYAELVTVDDPNASHINVKLPNDIVRRLKKFPELSNEIIILDCDFEDGYATDKTDNYSFYDNSYVYDVNNNSWFSISDEMEFNDYHYDCNPDFSVPVLEQGSSGSSDSLTNPYQVWILAEGWDNLWFMFNDIFCIKLSKLGDYFIYSYVGNSYNKFDVFIDSPEKTKSTARFETSIEFSEYYGKIIKITENSDAIEIVGDIYA